MSATCKRILGILLSVLCIAAGTGVCCVICNHPSEEVEETVSSFYREPADSLDVVMIGSSAAWKDFHPAVLWREQQITAYCMAIGACSGNVYASVLEEVLSRQRNAVILVDVDGFLVDDKYQTEQDPIRLWIDSMPRNRNRLETIRALTPDTMAERLFPFARYHRNMTSLQTYLPMTARLLKKQALHTRSVLKGAILNPNPSSSALQTQDMTSAAALPLDTESGRVLADFLRCCREKGLTDILFVNFPKAYSDDTNFARNELYAGRMQTICEQAAQYGYAAWDYNVLSDPAELDLETDYADTLHLTTDGAVKFSAILANYLVKQYDFAPKDDALRAQWDEDVRQAYALYGKD